MRLLVLSSSSWGWYGSDMFCDQPAIYFRQHNGLGMPVPYVKFFIPKEPKTRRELETLVKHKSRIETKHIITDMENTQEKELLPINEVRIGPIQHQKEAVQATEIFLRENGYDTIDVIPSDIPFRGY